MDAEKTGALIASTRREKKMTQRELAALLHVTDRAVSKWERGLSFPDVSLLVPLAEALDLTLTELMNGERTSPAADTDEKPLHEILTLSRAALRSRTVKLRLLVLAVCILALTLGGLGVYFLWNDPYHSSHALRMKNVPLSQKELALAEVSNAHVNRYRYALTGDVRTVRAVYEVWTEDGLFSEGELWVRDADELPLKYRGDFLYSVDLGKAFSYDGEENPEPVIRMSWSLPSSVIVGQSVPLPHEASGMVLSSAHPDQRDIKGDSVLLYLAEFTEKNSYAPKEAEAIERFTATAVRGDVPEVFPGEYTVAIWLEVGR